MKVHGLAALLAALASGCASLPDAPRGAVTATWGYVHAQCQQEQVAEPRHICEVGRDDEPGLAIIVSNIVRFDGKSLDPGATFDDEVRRVHGLALEGREVGPFATWQEAGQALDQSLRRSRQVEGGNIAFLAVSLEPERLADEPNAEEIEQVPPPLPDVSAAYRDETLTVWRTDTACGLRDGDGNAVLPPLVHEPFGEAGEGCPFQVAQGYGLYAFHVPRSGTICGAAGICTEFYGPDGKLLLVADHSPNLLPVHRDLHGLGLVVTGDRVQRLWSFVERRYVDGTPPFLDVGPDDRIAVAGASIHHNRLAVGFEHHHAGREAPDFALFYLDTRRFEDVVLADPASTAPDEAPPAFARYETERIDACVDDPDWLLGDDRRAETYLRDSYHDFDKHFRAFSGTLLHDIDRAGAPADFARLGARLDALMPRLGRLLQGASAPADSLVVARLAGAFGFQSPDHAAPGDGHAAWLRAALAQEVAAGAGCASDAAGERVDAFLTALARVRYRLRVLEAAGKDGVAGDLVRLHEEAQPLAAAWKGFDAVLEPVIFGEPPRLAGRLHPHVREMCRRTMP